MTSTDWVGALFVVCLFAGSALLATTQLRSIASSRREYEDRLHGIHEPYRHHELAALHPGELMVERTSPPNMRGYPSVEVFQMLEADYQDVYFERLKGRLEAIRAAKAAVSAISIALFGILIVPVGKWILENVGMAFSGGMTEALLALAAAFAALGLLLLGSGPFAAVYIGDAIEDQTFRLQSAYRKTRAQLTQ